MPITKATTDDLGPILELQYLAYQSEARLLGRNDIPPLRQTLGEILLELQNGIILKAANEEGSIVGSVRGRIDGQTLHVGKLMVHPDLQGRGLGTQLLTAIEKFCPKQRYELFTSDKSEKNIRLYERNGYVKFDARTIAPGLTLIFLEKRSKAWP